MADQTDAEVASQARLRTPHATALRTAPRVRLVLVCVAGAHHVARLLAVAVGELRAHILPD